jgi:hypothetical protein
VCEFKEIGKFSRLGRSRFWRFNAGRKFWEVSEVENF